MNRLSVGTVLRQFLPAFQQRFAVVSRILDTFKRLARCHTGQLGWTLQQCDSCAKLDWAPNGCGDRHCPDCHVGQREEWLRKQRDELLPVRYYHWVFTLPALLRPLVLQNQKLLYTLLFDAAAQSLLEFGTTQFNAQIGLTALLHTWGQDLGPHPHLHCLVTGGGLTAQGNWAGPKQSHYLFPHQAVASMFRGKFLAGLQRLRPQLQFHGRLHHWANPTVWTQQIQPLYQCKWNVFAKGSVVGPEALLQYLGRYTHRVAITNSRLVSINDDTVLFRYKSYANNGQIRQMTLAGVEFLRRLSLHVLPPGFTKVRYYGLLGNNRRKHAIPAARRALEQSAHRVDGSQLALEKPPAWLPQPCQRCGGLARTQVGRTDSSGKFTGLISGATRLWLRLREPPNLLNSS